MSEKNSKLKIKPNPQCMWCINSYTRPLEPGRPETNCLYCDAEKFIYTDDDGTEHEADVCIIGCSLYGGECPLFSADDADE